MAYLSLREYIQALDSRGKLFRIPREVSRETELHPLVRWQFRGLPESERRAFLFEKVASVSGRKYKMSVLSGACASSRAIYALGMGCQEDEIFDHWINAQKNPIDPVVVPQGPVQEIEIDSHLEDAVDSIPVPLANPGFDSSLRLTAALWITSDPETGQRNVGIYSGYIRKGGRISVGLGAGKDSRIHLDKAREKGLPLKAAVVIGPTPNLIYAAASTFPYGVDEYAVAGAIAGKPLELVRCRTADIYVPAQAEMILEGEISPDEMDHNWPFGEFSGYMAGRGKYPRFTVKHITHRENPILLDLVAAHPPCEGSKLKQIATEAIFYHGLKESVGMSGIKQVAIHEEQSHRTSATEATMAKSGKASRPPTGKMRCAIYTRKSSEEGLEQAFNSLDAQREACAAFVLSQKHEGWAVLPTLVRRRRLFRGDDGPPCPAAALGRYSRRPGRRRGGL